LALRFVADLADTSLDAVVAIGLILGVAPEDPTQPFDFSILLGQLNVFPTRPLTVSTYDPYLLWANFERAASPLHSMLGILTWDAAVSLAPVTAVPVSTPEDPVPVWELDMSEPRFPSFIYFNIFVQCHLPDGSVGGPEDATWIGTTGLEGRDNQFVVREQAIPGNAHGEVKVRFYVCGVTSHGEVLRWDRSVFVDVDL
jgi:mannosyl-glycoprotein endo-beta-N-acetylglucosaminidase